VKVSIWWIRRDLRLSDQPVLDSALRAVGETGQILPVFILDPPLLNSPYLGEKRLAFLLGGLRALDADLRRRGSRLTVRHGPPGETLARLAWEIESAGLELAGIFAEADHSPYARQRDERVARDLPFQPVGSPAVLPPGAVLKPDGTPYTIYTPFNRAWKVRLSQDSHSSIPAPTHINTLDWVTSLSIPAELHLPSTVPFPPGEEEAQRRLNYFLESGIRTYQVHRDRMDLDGTSCLSPYLRFGMLSPRQVVYTALAAIESAPDENAGRGVETWLNELIWRDFYIHVLHHFPGVRSRNFRSKEIYWQNDPGDFDAWREGYTGYPVVDAAMRQLCQSGWMHNRARMLSASFLTKDLLVDWRWGERWFMQHLVDGDPAANNGGWQWSAGTGTDAAPYFRIFNPVTQGLKFDPHGTYIRRWVPELRHVPETYLHAPWKMPIEVQRAAQCKIGTDYPAPLVDHAWARERALDFFGKV